MPLQQLALMVGSTLSASLSRISGSTAGPMAPHRPNCAPAQAHIFSIEKAE